MRFEYSGKLREKQYDEGIPSSYCAPCLKKNIYDATILRKIAGNPAAINAMAMPIKA